MCWYLQGNLNCCKIINKPLINMMKHALTPRLFDEQLQSCFVIISVDSIIVALTDTYIFHAINCMHQFLVNVKIFVGVMKCLHDYEFKRITGFILIW